MPGAAAPKEKKKADAAGAKQAAIDAATKYGITGTHLAQFLAQIDHESGHFKRLEENLSYSAKRLMEIFPKYYKDPALAEAEQRNPQLIANRVYGGRMGNGGPETGDGYRYRGRGLIQLTGKDNYDRFGKIVGLDLVSNPDSAADLVTAANLAAAYYKKSVLDRGIQAEDTKRVTKAINGGSIGLSDRQNLFALYQQQAPGAAPGAGGGQVYAAAGGVASGPTSGYPATLHGTEAIIPLNAQSHASRQAVAAVSKAVSGEQMSQQTAENTVASNKPAVIPIPVNTGGGGGGGGKSAPAQQPNNSVKASVRHQDDAFMRALSKDFVHPSTFASVSQV
jgi:putative chitinase